MYRPKFGSVLAAVALVIVTAIPMLAAPAGAATGCNADEFPATFGGQSGLKVECSVDPGTFANSVDIHDADNAVWHHGAARTVVLTCAPFTACSLAAPAGANATTRNSNKIKFSGNTLANAMVAADVHRPISAFNADGISIFPAGTFIVSVAPGSATVSQPAGAALANSMSPVTVKIEHTNNRLLIDATCAPNDNKITITALGSGTFSAADIGKSLTGGPFPPNAYITGPLSNSNHTVQFTPSLGATGCTTNNGGIPGADKIVVGAAFYGNPVPGSTPLVFDKDPMSVHLSNTTAGGQGFSCPTAATLVMTAAAVSATAGFSVGVVGLPVRITKSPGVFFDARITAVAVPNTITFAPASCTQNPAYITATTGTADIGFHGAHGPAKGAAMSTLAAELNLNPALIPTQDDCANGTYEGFEVVGDWQHPDSYTTWGPSLYTPRASVAELIMPTSLVTFTGFVVPAAGGDAADPNPHYDVSFPILPTAVGQCLSGGVPTEGAHVAIGVSATALVAGQQLAIGRGNLGDPGVRSLLPLTGSFSQTIGLGSVAGTENLGTFPGTPCVISLPSVATGFACGDG